MVKNRPALAALLGAAAAALLVLLSAGAASAEGLESKLEAKQAKLSEVQERRGVLTTTISHYGDRIERLTGEVAALRDSEAKVRVRLNAKQTELDRAVIHLAPGDLSKLLPGCGEPFLEGRLGVHDDLDLAVGELVDLAGARGAQGNLDPLAIQRKRVRHLQDPIDLVERHVFRQRWLHHNDAAHSSIPLSRVDNYGGIP